MIENVTLGAIATGLVFILGLWASLKTLKKETGNVVREVVKEEIKPLGEKLDALEKKVDDVDMGSVKNFLVATMSDIRKGDDIDEYTKMHFKEQYDHYIKMGGNSYIREYYEDLRKSGKI